MIPRWIAKIEEMQCGAVTQILLINQNLLPRTAGGVRNSSWNCSNLQARTDIHKMLK